MARQRRLSSTGSFRADPSILLLGQIPDASADAGARNAVRVCLAVRETERAVLIVESGMEKIASSFFRELKDATSDVEVFLVSPLQAAQALFVERVVDSLARAEVSMLICSVDGLPTSFRHAVIDAPGRRRHGHMPGLELSMMQQGMRADYEEIDALGARLTALLGRGGTLHVKTPRGTDLSVGLGTRYRWHSENGLLRAPGWTNLPAGELLTTPESVDGVLVPDGGMWDALGEPVPHADRMTLSIAGGRVISAVGRAGADPSEWLAQLAQHENATRVGQVAFGTNVGVIASVGTLLQDVKMPGIHLMLGHTAPEHTGAEWTSDVELPLLLRRADVDLGDTPILRSGRFVPDLLVGLG